ncbi:MAG: HAD family hydrolase [Xanthomonadaceae bacterium]|nr:HAD family hydrolase [Xanthomonadaceae bacterium]
MRKIVFDFDGVLTDLTHEAQAVIDLFQSKLGTESRGLLKQLNSAFSQSPLSYGWKMHGRVSAFYDEDLFVQNIAMATALDELSPKQTSELLKKIQGEFGAQTFSELGQQCFDQVVAKTSRGEIQPLEAASKNLLNELQDKGFKVVIVSNSGTERIENILKQSGVTLCPHLKIRGGARKFELGTEPKKLQFVDREIDIDRPAYLEALMEERPDAVVGDVFSLDLSLPLYLSENSVDGFKPLKVCLRQRPYTPSWTVKNIQSFKPKRARLVAIQNLSQVLEDL